jgi:hypothetical protein
MRWSASSADLLSKCGEAFRRRYVERDRRKDHRVPNTIGKAVHLEAQVDLEVKIEEGVLMEDERVEDVAASVFEDMWDGLEPDLSDEEKVLGRDTVKGSSKDVTIALARTHHQKIAPLLKPVAVERRLEAWADGLRHPIIGYIDVQEEDSVRDLKTPAKKPRLDDLHGSTQAALYPWLVEAVDGVRPSSFKIDAVVKNKTPTVVTLETQVLRSDHVFERLYRSEELLQAGTFLPADPTSWKCSEKWCEFFEDCPWGRARRSSFSMSND